MKWKISALDSKFRQHIFFKFLKKPFPTNPLNIIRRVDINSNISEMFIYNIT